jgi:hypothetical protein
LCLTITSLRFREGIAEDESSECTGQTCDPITSKPAPFCHASAVHSPSMKRMEDLVTMLHNRCLVTLWTVAAWLTRMQWHSLQCCVICENMPIYPSGWVRVELTDMISCCKHYYGASFCLFLVLLSETWCNTELQGLCSSFSGHHSTCAIVSPKSNQGRLRSQKAVCRTNSSSTYCTRKYL